jgi:hypothetical protein
MFIKISILVQPDTAFDVIVSTPDDAFKLICILDKSEKVVAWNMGDDKPEHFGWMKSTFWDKYNDVFFK